MISVELPFKGKDGKLLHAMLPNGTQILKMRDPEPVIDPGSAVLSALENPIGSEPLSVLAFRTFSRVNARGGLPPTACIVVSDSTRPVPYRGPGGLLYPIIGTLRKVGFEYKDICILVATGTHRAMAQLELEAMLGPEVFNLGIKVANHDCRADSTLVFIGTTSRGTRVRVNSLYVKADLKILTGLVESHFMAGVSGGRKAICPGIIGEEGTHVFHGAEMMADPLARDLSLDRNPVHEESLAIAKMAGVDFIANVTVDSSFKPTGYFFGDLETAHKEAAAALSRYVSIPIQNKFDLIVSHAGYVGVNHYQAAKAAVAAAAALGKGGGLIMLADNHDRNPIGSDRYKILLGLLKEIGPEAFTDLLKSKDWKFIPEQWQVQMWAKVFAHISPSDFIYFAPQLQKEDWGFLPGVDGSSLFPRTRETLSGPEAFPAIIDAAVSAFLSKRGFSEDDVECGKCRIAWLADGPYGIPIFG